MTLKSKISLILVSVFVLYGIVNFGIHRSIIFPSFLSLEHEEAEKNVNRSVRAIEREIHHLDLLCSDWAGWDDTYEFIESYSDTYVKSNLTITAFTENKVNSIHYVDRNGKVVWGRNYDFAADKDIRLNEFPIDKFPASHSLISLKFENKSLSDVKITGVFVTDKGPMLISCRPILTSNSEGPARGVLIFGRLLNDEIVNVLTDQTNVNFQIFPTIDGVLPGWVQDIPNRITDESGNLVEVCSDDRIDSYTIFPDIKGNIAFLIKSVTERKITDKGNAVMRYAAYSVLATGTGVLIMVLLIFHFSVLSPIGKLKNHVVSIGKTGDLSLTIPEQRRDELGVLAREFNKMLRLLQGYHTELERMVEVRTDELRTENNRLRKELDERGEVGAED